MYICIIVVTYYKDLTSFENKEIASTGMIHCLTRKIKCPGDGSCGGALCSGQVNHPPVPLLLAEYVLVFVQTGGKRLGHLPILGNSNVLVPCTAVPQMK